MLEAEVLHREPWAAQGEPASAAIRSSVLRMPSGAGPFARLSRAAGFSSAPTGGKPDPAGKRLAAVCRTGGGSIGTVRECGRFFQKGSSDKRSFHHAKSCVQSGFGHNIIGFLAHSELNRDGTLLFCEIEGFHADAALPGWDKISEDGCRGARTQPWSRRKAYGDSSQQCPNYLHINASKPVTSDRISAIGIEGRLPERDASQEWRSNW